MVRMMRTGIRRAVLRKGSVRIVYVPLQAISPGRLCLLILKNAI